MRSLTHTPHWFILRHSHLNTSGSAKVDPAMECSSPEGHSRVQIGRQREQNAEHDCVAHCGYRWSPVGPHWRRWIGRRRRAPSPAPPASQSHYRYLRARALRPRTSHPRLSSIETEYIIANVSVAHSNRATHTLRVTACYRARAQRSNVYYYTVRTYCTLMLRGYWRCRLTLHSNWPFLISRYLNVRLYKLWYWHPWNNISFWTP